MTPYSAIRRPDGNLEVVLVCSGQTARLISRRVQPVGIPLFLVLIHDCLFIYSATSVRCRCNFASTGRLENDGARDVDPENVRVCVSG